MKEENKKAACELDALLSELSKVKCDSVNFGEVIVDKTFQTVIDILCSVRSKRLARNRVKISRRDWE